MFRRIAWLLLTVWPVPLLAQSRRGASSDSAKHVRPVAVYTLHLPTPAAAGARVQACSITPPKKLPDQIDTVTIKTIVDSVPAGVDAWSSFVVSSSGGDPVGVDEKKVAAKKGPSVLWTGSRDDLDGEALVVYRVKSLKVECTASLSDLFHIDDEQAAAPPAGSAKPTNEIPPVAAIKDRDTLDYLDSLAMATVVHDSIGRLPRVREHGHAKIYEVYLLPSGRSVPGMLPQRVTEQDLINIHQIRAYGYAPWLAVRACPNAVVDRTDGNPVSLAELGDKISQAFSASSAKADSQQKYNELIAGLERPHPAHTFTIEDLPPFTCSDSIRLVAGVPFLSDDAKSVRIDSTVTTLPITKVQRFVWGLAAAMDFARLDRWDLADRPKSDLSGTEKYVRHRYDMAGPRPYLTLSIHWCGLILDDRMTTCEFLSPILGLDLRHPTTDFSVALSPVTVWGIHLLTGVSIAQAQRLSPDVNGGIIDTTKRISAGSTWTVPGDIPTETYYSAKKSFGFYVGLGTSASRVLEWIPAKSGSK